MDEMERIVAVKTTRITVETETQMIVHRAKAVLAWCPGCRAEVDVVILDHDNFSEPTTAAHLKAWIGTGSLHLHFWQTPEGPVRICLSSLLQCFDSAETRAFFHSCWNPLARLRRKQR